MSSASSDSATWRQGAGDPDACFADPELLPVEEAWRRIRATVTPVDAAESLHLRAALDRILAEDVASPLDVPGFTNSAMDGFAVRGVDLPADGTDVREFDLVGTAWAGKPLSREVGAGQAARIMTGAVMPAGTDTVVMQEQAEASGQQVCLGAGHRTGQNVREAGEDLRRGQVVLTAGRRLLPAELGLLASLGVPEVKVRRKLRVATFSTGDELRSVGQPLSIGQIYDSNRYTLYGMLTQMGVEIVDLGVINDRFDAIRDAFEAAAACADVVISTGGASTSEADHVAQSLKQLGQVGFWRIAIRPGRPLAFGTINGAQLFGLPGNPVAVMVTFYQFVQPALRLLMGEANPRPAPLVRARTEEDLRKKPGRVEVYRAVLGRADDGALTVRQTGKSGSALLHTMSDANCFIVLDEAQDSVEAGAEVDVQPFFGVMGTS